MLLPMMPIFFIIGTVDGNLTVFGGGWTWQAAAYAFWEQLFCVAVCVGLTVWFREKLNFQNRLTKALSERSYGAYILQAPILFFLAIALASWQMPLLLKFILLSPVAVALCFLTAFVVRKIPKADNLL